MTTVFITKIVDLTKTTDTCTACGADCAPFQGRWDIDPLCTACKASQVARDTFLPLDTPHDLYFALAAPAAYLPSLDTDPADLPEAQGLWRF